MLQETGDQSLAGLLRGHRLAANLTQAALAERAGISSRAVQDLERGLSRPHTDTLTRLIAALGLSEEDQDLLVSKAVTLPRRRAPQMEVVATTPGIRAAGERRRIPIAPTSLIGREHDVVALGQLLETARLVTLVGPAGIGKTRLALEVMRTRFADPGKSVVFVELASLVDPMLVSQTLAQAVGVREQTGRSVISSVAQYIGDADSFLLLDNCEHVLDGCAACVSSLLATCAGLAILATSREPLGITGEVVWRVPRLSIPRAEVSLSLENIEQIESVRLFAERAQAALTSFKISEETAPAITQICQALDGLPLALELAAPWVRILSVEQIAQRVGETLRLLSNGPRAAPARHQSLTAAIDWSYALLSEAERRLFERLAAFSGSWTLEAAEGVGAADGLEKSEILDLLRGLVEKSMVHADPADDGEMRYRLLETLSLYGWEHLEKRGDADNVRRRHADYFIGLGERAEPHMRGGPLFAWWLNRLEPDRDNLRSALRWCIEHGEVERGLRLGGAVWRWWSEQGSLSEGRDWLELLLRIAQGSARNASLARALNGAGVLAYDQGDFQTARAMLEESRAIWSELGDSVRVGACTHNLASVAMECGDYEAARTLYGEALALQHGEPVRVAITLSNLGWLHVVQGDYAQALATSLQSAEMYREMGDELDAAWCNIAAGWAILRSGDPLAAHALLADSLTVSRTTRPKSNDTIVNCLDGLAAVAAARGECERALRIAASADRQRRVSGRPASRSQRTLMDWSLQPVREQMTPESAAAAWAEGAALSLDDAIDYCLT